MNKRLLMMIVLMLFASQSVHAGLGGPSNKHKDNYSSISKQGSSKSLGKGKQRKGGKEGRSKKRRLKGSR